METKTHSSLRRSLEDWRRLIRADSYLLRDHPGLLFQQAANQPDRSAPAIAARHRREKGLAPDTWFEWKNRPQQIDPCIMTLTDHTEQVWACAFSPDGSQIATASQDGMLRLWDADTGASIAVLDAANMLQGCAFSPDGTRVMAVSSYLAKVWDVQTGAEVSTLAGERLWIQAWAYLADGPRIIVTDTGGDGVLVKVWDVERASELLTLSGYAFLGKAFAFSPDGAYIVSAEERLIKIYDARTGAEIGVSAEIDSTMSHCSVSPDSNLIVAGCIDGTLKLWNARTLELVSTLSEHEGSLTACAFSPDSTFVVSTSGGWDNRNDIKIWDAKAGSEIGALTGHKDWIKCCAYSADGKRLVTASNDMTAKIWDVEAIDATPAPPTHKARVSSCQYFPDSNLLASAADDWTVKLWDTNDGAEVAAISEEDTDILSFALAPDGKQMIWASRSDDLIKVWDNERREQIATITAPTGGITRCEFLPDGDRLVLVENDGTIRVWSIDERREIAKFGEHRGKFTGFCRSPDGERIVTASGYHDYDHPADSFGDLYLWETRTGDRMASLLGHKDRVSCCAFSPDATRIVSGSGDGALKVWDARTGVEVRTLTGHLGAVYSCAYSPDGRQIVSSSADWTLRMWGGASGEQLAEFGWVQVVQTCRYSPDGKFILTIPLVGGLSWNDSIKIWSSSTFSELTSFRPARTISCFAVGKAGRRLALGDDWGRVYVLDLLSAEAGTPIVTAMHVDRSVDGNKANPTARCDWCGEQFTPSGQVLDAIGENGRDLFDTVALDNPSPCEQLPSAAWDEPRLSTRCPCCDQPLRFNPFIVDNRDRY